MPGDTLKDRLQRTREITLSVTGRTTGRTVSMPVWFVLEGETLYLLPYQGSDTQWYRNVLKNPKVKVSTGSVESELTLTPVTGPKEVSSIVEKFRGKHGRDVKAYYSKFDVATMATLT